MQRFCRRSVICEILLPICAALLLPAFAAPQDRTGSRNGKPDAKADSLIAKQQALFERINLAGAWKITKGDPKILVGVIDNGFDYFHPDLLEQVLPGYYSAGGYHSEMYQNMSHGTLVASLIVARGQGNDSMSGLAPRCKALTASQGTLDHKLIKFQHKFFRQNPEATMQDFQKELLNSAAALRSWGVEWSNYQAEGAATAVRYLTDHGVRVINFSYLLRRSLIPNADMWKKLEESFAYAACKNVVIVIGAGNDGALTDDYPGDAKTVIVAGATLLDDKRWETDMEIRGMKIKQGSNFGKRLTCMAPVEDLLVCTPHERRMYEVQDGPYGAIKEEFKGIHDVLKVGATSSATPIVSSLAALVVSARPDLDAPTVVDLIKKGCDDLGEPGFDIHTGYGRINFAKTVQLAVALGKK